MNVTSPSAMEGSTNSRRVRVDLFCISVLLLFLELACIRWFPAHILFLTFFTNSVLLASFLGISLGCLAARQTHNYLLLTPFLLCAALLCGACMDGLRLSSLVDVGNQGSPQMVYFGAERGPATFDEFSIPIELIAGIYFVLIALMMVGPGQELGRALNQVPERVQAYAINILGSLVGIALFAACSWFHLGPIFWFVPIALALAYYLRAQLNFLSTPRGWLTAAALLASPIFADPPSGARAYLGTPHEETIWSPYYRIGYLPPPARSISANLISHQEMIACEDPAHAYALPHILNRDSGGRPFKNVLIIGAGSGNDVARALQWGDPDTRVDAVEIDPVILALGRRDHPNHPYQDARVTTHTDDGRNFLHNTDKKYDLIVFALVDSLVLHSGYSNIRLESYLFTEEAFRDVRHRLNPDGLFIMYNYYRQGWIVARLESTLKKVFAFEGDPLVMAMPYAKLIQPDEHAEGFTALLAGGRVTAMRQAFERNGEYWLGNKAVTPLSPSGFGRTHEPDALRFGPASLAPLDAPLPCATDDWPFLYLRAPMLPDLSVRGMILMALLSLGLLYVFWPRAQPDAAGSGFNGRMFLLGAGFMLVETKAVVHMALLLGSTWIVNSVVFFAVLLMILAANLLVLRLKSVNLRLAYAGLFVALAANVVIPLEWFLGLARVPQLIGSCVLVFSPILFAGVIFATCYSEVRQADQAFGWNIAGAMFGGLAENFSMLAGFRYLIILAALFYALSAVCAREQADVVDKESQ